MTDSKPYITQYIQPNKYWIKSGSWKFISENNGLIIVNTRCMIEMTDAYGDSSHIPEECVRKLQQWPHWFLFWVMLVNASSFWVGYSLLIHTRSGDEPVGARPIVFFHVTAPYHKVTTSFFLVCSVTVSTINARYKSHWYGILKKYPSYWHYTKLS